MPKITKQVGSFYITDHLLGKGANAVVYLARSVNESCLQEYACKIIEKDKFSTRAFEALK
jgi:hypothetical protein